MPSIPKKVKDNFNSTIPKYQKVLELAKNHDVNESDTASIIND